MAEPRISSTFTVRHAAGDPIAAVRVRNLSATVRGPHDAWGRPSQPQPALISAEVSFRDPFNTAAAADRLGVDTVNYSTLSKAVLASLEPFGPGVFASGAWVDEEERAKDLRARDVSLRDVLDAAWLCLTGEKIAGGGDPGESELQEQNPAQVGFSSGKTEPFLVLDQVRFLSVTVRLPKASLLGDGVSLTASAVFGGETATEMEGFGIAVRLHRLKVPTLVGLNPHERMAKQFVIASVEIDKFDYHADVYTELESVVTKAMESSSFETLEALATNLAETVSSWSNAGLGRECQIRICLEKPTAVPFAECPEVEIRVNAGGSCPSTA